MLIKKSVSAFYLSALIGVACGGKRATTGAGGSGGSAGGPGGTSGKAMAPQASPVRQAAPQAPPALVVTAARPAALPATPILSSLNTISYDRIDHRSEQQPRHRPDRLVNQSLRLGDRPNICGTDHRTRSGGLQFQQRPHVRLQAARPPIPRAKGPPSSACLRWQARRMLGRKPLSHCAVGELAGMQLFEHVRRRHHCCHRLFCRHRSTGGADRVCQLSLWPPTTSRSHGGSAYVACRQWSASCLVRLDRCWCDQPCHPRQPEQQ